MTKSYGTYEPYAEQNVSYSKMYRAFREGTVESLDKAIAEGDNPFYRHSNGHTMMHYAIARGHNPPPMLERLEYYGLDVNKPDEDGRRPIHQAIICNDVRSVHCLLALGADLAAQLDNGYNGFHLTAPDTNPEIPRLLYRYGVNPEQTENKGKTPDELFQSQGQGWRLEAFEQWKEQQRIPAAQLSDGTPLRDVFAQDGVYTSEETTMRSWKMLPQMLQKAQQDGVEIAPDALAKMAMNASNQGILPQMMTALHAQNMSLPLTALIDSEGRAKAELETIAENWDLKCVLSPENCKGQPKNDISRVYDAVPAEQQQQIRNLHRLRAAAGTTLPSIAR